MEAIPDPVGWHEIEEPEHHQDCPAFDDDRAGCRCPQIKADMRDDAMSRRHERRATFEHREGA